jgi:hypothetical protein
MFVIELYCRKFLIASGASFNLVYNMFASWQMGGAIFTGVKSTRGEVLTAPLYLAYSCFPGQLLAFDCESHRLCNQFIASSPLINAAIILE